MPSPPSVPTRILLVDDQPIVRVGLSYLLAREPDLTVCGEAESVIQAMEQIAAEKPDLAIVELSLKGGTGLELVRMVHSVAPQLPTLVLSSRDETLFAERALRAGARGYVMKSAPTATLRLAVREVLAGRAYVSDQMSQNLLGRLGHDGLRPGGRLGNLTDRELAVFELVGEGLNSSAIAERLQVSLKTIETYRSNIKSKLGLKDAVDLIRHATAWNVSS